MMRQFWQVPFGSQGVNLTDGPQLDAFHRMRVGLPETTFDFQSVYGNDLQFWDSALVGTGAVSDLLTESAVQCSTGGTASGAKATRQSRRYMRYRPGKSQLILRTFSFVTGPTTNLRRRIGYYDDNDGVFLEQTSSGLFIVLRSSSSGSIVETRIAQSSWNLDKLDGTGSSGITLDVTKCNILVIDIQWLGSGRARLGFDLNQRIVYAHEFNNANTITTAYMQTGDLPCREEIENTGVTAGTNTLKTICTSVISEGGTDQGGVWKLGTASNTTGVTTGATRLPILSVRPKATFNTKDFRGYIDLLSASIIASSGGDVVFSAVAQATLTGASFVDAFTGYSAVEYDVSATAITGGIPLFTAFLSGNTSAMTLDITGFNKPPLVRSADNTNGNTITITATKIGAVATTAYASFNWREQH